MTDRQKRNLLAGTSAVGGASAASMALDSDAVQLALLRNDPRFRAIYLAGIGAGADAGSGEARMAANNALMARRGGVNTVFVNPMHPSNYVKSDTPARKQLVYRDASAKIDHLSFSDRDKNALITLFREQERGNKYAVGQLQAAGITEIAGTPIEDWNTVIRRIAGDSKTRANVVSGILNGKYDDFMVGELGDNLKVLALDGATGRIPMMPAARVREDPSAFMFSGERGMRYSTVPGLDWRDWQSVVKDDVIAGRRNLARDTGFGANYTPEITKIIPASKMDTGLVNRSDLLSRMKHFLDRRALKKYILGNNGAKIGTPASLDGKKIIFMSGGSAQPMAPEKIREALRATEGMDDVHIFAQIGGGVSESNPHRWYGDMRRELEEAARSGRITFTDYIPQNLMNRFYNGADLNLGYGGSSSATELLGVRAPTIFMHDSDLNRGNIDFVKRMGNGTMRDFDSAAAGIWGRVKDFMDSHPGSTVDDAFEHLKDYQVAQGKLHHEKSIFDRAVGLGDSGVDSIRGKFRRDIRELLEPGVRESVANRSRVKNAIRSMVGRNREVVGITRDALLSHAEGLRRLYKNVGKVPMKYKVPAILASAAIPAAATYSAMKPKKSGIDSVLDALKRNFGG